MEQAAFLFFPLPFSYPLAPETLLKINSSYPIQYFSKIYIPLRKERVSLEWNFSITSKIKILLKIVIVGAAPAHRQEALEGSWVAEPELEGSPERGEAGPKLMLLWDSVKSILKVCGSVQSSLKTWRIRAAISILVVHTGSGSTWPQLLTCYTGLAIAFQENKGQCWFGNHLGAGYIPCLYF